MKKLLMLLVLALSAMTLAQNADAQLSRLHFKGYKIYSIVPKSFTSVEGTARIELRNDTTSFKMTGITGTVYKKGKPFVNGHADDVMVTAGTGNTYISGNASLCSGVGFLEVLSCLAFNPADYTIDVSLTVVMGRDRRKVEKKGISVKNLLSNYFNRQN